MLANLVHQLDQKLLFDYLDLHNVLNIAAGSFSTCIDAIL